MDAACTQETSDKLVSFYLKCKGKLFSDKKKDESFREINQGNMGNFDFCICFLILSYLETV